CLDAEIYHQLAVMREQFSSHVSNLNACVNAFNKVAGNIETRVFVTARKFSELGAEAMGADIRPLDQVDQITRDIQAPELLPEMSENAAREIEEQRNDRI